MITQAQRDRIASRLEAEAARIRDGTSDGLLAITTDRTRGTSNRGGVAMTFYNPGGAFEKFLETAQAAFFSLCHHFLGDIYEMETVTKDGEESHENRDPGKVLLN